MNWYITIHKPAMKAKGGAFWPIVLLRDLEDKKTLAHEEAHLKDQLSLGILPWLVLYSIFALIYGYDRNPFEKWADAVEEGTKWKFLGWINYLNYYS